jgi:hypothetical protein
MYHGTPRDILANTEEQNKAMKKNGRSIQMVFEKKKEALKILATLIPLDCLVGPNDKVPGIAGNKLPAQVTGL